MRFLDSKKNFDIDIKISDERDQILETGGGLKKARDLFKNEPFLLCNTDIISDIDLKAMYEAHLKTNGLATLATRHRPTSRYLIFDEAGILHGWTNVNTGEIKMSLAKRGQLRLRAFSGIHVLSPDIFDLMDQEGKFSIIDVYLKSAADHRIYEFAHDDDVWIDVGKKDTLDKAQELIKQFDF